MWETFELGPMLNVAAPDFTLSDHNHRPQQISAMLGRKGIMLGFIGDIWQPVSVRRIFWLQRHAGKFALAGTPVALLVRENPHTLYGFRMSSPLPVPFPLLADADGRIHQAYNMDRHPGLVLLDRQRSTRAKWLMPDERIWPRMQELLAAVETLPG